MSGERPPGSVSLGGSRREGRGQTQIDFAVGAGVFLLALAFVVAFVPTLFEPFAVADTAAPLVSDRIAAGTVDLLGASPNASGAPTAIHAPTEPGVLSPACTVAFFAADATLADDAGCPFDAESDPAELFGVDDDVQVVIHGLDENASADNAVNKTFETRHGTVRTTLNRSTTYLASTADDVTVSGRVVSLRGKQYRLTVRVW